MTTTMRPMFLVIDAEDGCDFLAPYIYEPVAVLDSNRILYIQHDYRRTCPQYPEYSVDDYSLTVIGPPPGIDTEDEFWGLAKVMVFDTLKAAAEFIKAENEIAWELAEERRTVESGLTKAKPAR